MKPNTAILHGPNSVDPTTGSPLPPIAQVSAFAQPSAEQMERVFRSQTPGFVYTRLANPTISVFEQRVAALEGGFGAVACASGMAAIAMALLNLLKTGDEIVATCQLYGGTLNLFHNLEHFGITIRLAPGCRVEDIEPVITEKTRLIFTETISNPGLNVADIAALAEMAHRHNLPLLVDNTSATSVLVQPLKLGADIVIHSSSKYINGSGDAISGVIVDGGRFSWDPARWPVLAPFCQPSKAAFTKRLRQDIWQNFGPCISPQNAYLNVLGIETMSLRVEKACHNALALARTLEQLPGIYAVNYPGLESSSVYNLTKVQMKDGMGGALLTFRAGSKERAFAIINHLKCAFIISNIGDVRTLAIHPASSIFIHSSVEEMERTGVYDDLIRVSVGIEDAEDLVEDFTQAVASLKSPEAKEE